MAIASLAPDSSDAFGDLTAPYRGALLAHCYRMLGSLDDAEDAVQEALVRAWRSRATFTEAVSFRAWLYRIATNVCLDTIERRKRTVGSSGLGGRIEVQPVPEDLIDEPSAGPEARYDARESISLAFLTALQVLSPRQRGVLLLRDVLGWRANEVADLLGLSVPAANSALHRARRALAVSYVPQAVARVPEPGRLRSLLDRYVRAWEAADIAGLVSLLREDAVVSMPPGLVITGVDAIARFLAETVFVGGRHVELVPVRANGAATFLIRSGRNEAELQSFAVMALELAEDVPTGADGEVGGGVEAGADGELGGGVEAGADVEGGADVESDAGLRVTRMGVFSDPRLVDRFVSAR
jgi:RNA polymerase sigma-70 factor (ECF subfamily)